MKEITLHIEDDDLRFALFDDLGEKGINRRMTNIQDDPYGLIVSVPEITIKEAYAILDSTKK